MAETKTCKCQNCGATIEVETGKTYFNADEIDRVAVLEKKVKALAQLAGVKSRKKGDKPNDKEKGGEGGSGSGEPYPGGGLLPF